MVAKGNLRLQEYHVDQVGANVDCCPVKCAFFSDVFILLAVENRVRPLVLVVKKWASFHELNDASRGTLSSYTLVLMVLHYLQSKYFFYMLKLSLLSSDLCSFPL